MEFIFNFLLLMGFCFVSGFLRSSPNESLVGVEGFESSLPKGRGVAKGKLPLPSAPKLSRMSGRRGKEYGFWRILTLGVCTSLKWAPQDRSEPEWQSSGSACALGSVSV